MATRATIRVTAGERDQPSSTTAVLLEHALQSWLTELRLSNRSQTTIDWHRDLFVGRILPGLKRQGVLTVGQIRREHVRELREQLQREGRRPRYRFGKRVPSEHRPLTPSSLHAYHRVLRAFYRWCLAEGFSQDRGIGSVKAPKQPSNEPRVFTATEVEAMLRAATPRDRLILELLLGTGLRLFELCGLQVPDFRLDHPDGPYLDVRERIQTLAVSTSRSLAHVATRPLAPHYRSLWIRLRSSSMSHLFVTEHGRAGEDRRPLSRNSVELSRFPS